MLRARLTGCILVIAAVWAVEAKPPAPPSWWWVLGPFPYGYRELGGDPVARWGGVEAIPVSTTTQYPSELSITGTIGWTNVSTAVDGSVNLGDFQGVNWDSLLSFFGNPGQLWQGVAVGTIQVSTPGVYLFQCVDHDFTQTFTQTRFWVDDVLLNFLTGNYNFALFPVRLEAGAHTMRVHISGQWNSESFTCSIFDSGLNSPDDDGIPALRVLSDTVLPQIVNGWLTGDYFSVAFLNESPTTFATNLQISVNASQPGVTGVPSTIFSQPVSLAPGQALPVTVQLNQTLLVQGPLKLVLDVRLDEIFALSFTVVIDEVAYGDPFVFTFLDVDGSLQYAAATPPAQPCPQGGCSVLLTVHGADVQAQSTAWTGAYQRQQVSWTLFPTNRRPLGYDWQGPGADNVWYSLAALETLAVKLNDTAAIDKNRLLYAGHSMGGHGCLLLGTHHPDRALAMAPAAGWIDWEMYVPFFNRVGDSGADPVLLGLLHASIAEYDADLYTRNLVGLPIIVRNGQNDTVVPPWHLLRIARLVNELSSGFSSPVGAVQISEVPGEGHWWSGVVDDAVMQKFFDTYLPAQVPPFPATFDAVTLNPASSGSRGWIAIQALTRPFRLGRVRVATGPGLWTLVTSNVDRFQFAPIEAPTRPIPTQLLVDGSTIKTNGATPIMVCRDATAGTWAVCTSWTGRGPSQYGPLSRVVEGPVMIIVGTNCSMNETKAMQAQATWLANEMYLTGRFSPLVLHDDFVLDSTANASNLILFGGHHENGWTRRLNKPTAVQQSYVCAALSAALRLTHPAQNPNTFTVGDHTYGGAGVGAIFMTPWQEDKLAVVIAGTDIPGMVNAAKFFPTHTGQTVPEYAVLGSTFGWEGAAGILAAGFYDNLWQAPDALGYFS